MKIISELLTDHHAWIEFLNYRLTDRFLPSREAEELRAFVLGREYEGCFDAFFGTSLFPTPCASTVNKQFSSRKRTVYLFEKREKYFLKFISFCLLRYDSVFSDNLCSFRKKITVKSVIRRLSSINGIENKYSYKADISDYFNSVDISLLLPVLENTLSDDPKLFSFLRSILENPYVMRDGMAVKEKKGIMAGVPVSSFLANLYLRDIDEYYAKRNVIYLRYSDDIIIFADTEQEIKAHADKLRTMLSEHNLTLNTSKELLTPPHEKWDFLGFSYLDGKIDVSSAALEKLKKKMKRKARTLYRWKIRNGASDERAVRAFISNFNRKLFDNPSNSEATWTRWYFPVINTDESLHILDSYMQDCVRYIAKGNYSKSRFDFRYKKMKELGYISLVNSYYKFIKNRQNPTDIL